jgi:hypothetical protein
MMLHLKMIEVPNQNSETQPLDFLTFNDELPAAVVFGPTGAKERGTYCTAVKHETTDDN